MAKVLELLFENEDGRLVRYTLDSPQEPVSAEAISEVMDLIISANLFQTSGGDVVAKRGARLVERNVEEIEMVESMD